MISHGRQHPQPDDGRGTTRDPFARDRDRIVHSVAFRRLRHKTQVFIAPDGDHYRVRLTHSLEVAQIGRTIARGLGLNEDLTEALCLAHDLGHPPFGHAGEAALDRATREAGGFDHNGHTLRTVTRLERPYADWPGLNLSWETLEGLAKHNGPVLQPGWALTQVDADCPLALDRWPTMEAQVAALADDIAYDNHDIDDGLRAGLLTGEQLLNVPMVRSSWDRVRSRRPDLAGDTLWREVVREQIGRMVTDVMASTVENAWAAGVRNSADLRQQGHAIAGFSPSMADGERELKRAMYDLLYHHPRQREMAEIAGHVVERLVGAYREWPDAMGAGWAERMPEEEPGRSRHVADFIAGMTDRFAVAAYRAQIGPLVLPIDF